MDKITFYSMFTTVSLVLTGGFFVNSLYSLFDGYYVSGVCYLISVFISAYIGYKSSVDLAKEHRSRAIQDHIRKGEME